jgi:hypothetical protein
LEARSEELAPGWAVVLRAVGWVEVRVAPRERRDLVHTEPRLPVHKAS